VLIINCETDGLILADEWRSAVQQVENLGIHKSFRDAFRLAPKGHHSISLWGAREYA
jgi:hypothetical protein